MKIIIKPIFMLLLPLFLFSSCQKEELTGPNISQLFYLKHKGATMPVLVEGNIGSDVIILMLHGGPGGSFRHINRILTSFTDPLEEKYAVAYWDQRMASDSRQTSSKLSLDLMTEDTDKLVDFLKYKFGEDVKIFLLGHSWGGMLGTNYLLDSHRQQKISGWVEVCGAHDIPKTNREAFELMNEVANEQISNNINKEKWALLIEDMEDIDINNYSYEDALKINQNGSKAVKIATEDGIVEEEFLISDESWRTIYNGLFGEFSQTANISNNIQIQQSELWDHLWEDGLSLSDELYKINTPSLFAYGKYDFVVPSPQGTDAYDRIGTPDEDKKSVIFERSGHLPFDSETELFLNHLIEFIDKYK